MRISYWSSDVCSSDLSAQRARRGPARRLPAGGEVRTHHYSILNVMAVLVTAIHAIDISINANCESFRANALTDRKSVGKGKSVSVRVDLGGLRIIKKKIKQAVSREIMK